MRITLVYAPAQRQVVEESMELPAGSTVLDALITSGWRDRFSLDLQADIELGLWNHKASLQTVLKDLDRVEIYRPLTIDPKEDLFAVLMIQAPGQKDYYRMLFRTLVYAAVE